MKREPYFREDWVSDQIENWLGYSPAGQASSIAWTEALGVRIEVARGSSSGIGANVDHSERTNFALDRLVVGQRCALVLYHTSRTLTYRQMSNKLNTSTKEVRRLLFLAHPEFVNSWEIAKGRAVDNDRNRPERRASA